MRRAGQFPLLLAVTALFAGCGESPTTVEPADEFLETLSVLTDASRAEPDKSAQTSVLDQLLHQAIAQAARQGGEDAVRRITAGLRQLIVSVGLPIMVDAGVYRGSVVIVPPEDDVERAIPRGWVDLRAANCGTWITRAQRVVAQAAAQGGFPALVAGARARSAGRAPVDVASGRARRERCAHGLDGMAHPRAGARA